MCVGCIVFDPSSQAPLGEFSLPRFRAPTHGLGIMCICVFIVCKLRVVRTPSGQQSLCEIMYRQVLCIYLFTKSAQSLLCLAYVVYHIDRVCKQGFCLYMIRMVRYLLMFYAYLPFIVMHMIYNFLYSVLMHSTRLFTFIYQTDYHNLMMVHLMLRQWSLIVQVADMVPRIHQVRVTLVKCSKSVVLLGQ